MFFLWNADNNTLDEFPTLEAVREELRREIMENGTEPDALIVVEGEKVSFKQASITFPDRDPS
jgi:hypothetical protein